MNSKISLVDQNGQITSTFNFITGEYCDIDYPNEVPLMFIPESFYRIFTAQQKLIVVIGAQGSGKSTNIIRLILARMMCFFESGLCLQQFQKDTDMSIKPLMAEQIKFMADAQDFDSTAETVTYDKAVCQFAGMNTLDGNVKIPPLLWFDNAQECSIKTISKLEDISKQCSRLILTAKLGSRNDPFSVQFVNDYIDKLDSNGIFENDELFICQVSPERNPWCSEEQRQQRAKDKNKLPHQLYKNIWESGFNDNVNTLIKREWIAAAIDADLKFKTLGFVGSGRKRLTVSANENTAVICVRQGNVIKSLLPLEHIDIEESVEVAIKKTLAQRIRYFDFDIVNVTQGLLNRIDITLSKSNIKIYQFDGNRKVEFPLRPVALSLPFISSVDAELTWKELCQTALAQNYIRLADRLYRTYRYVVFDERCHINDIISISSDCNHLTELIDELCRISLKWNNGKLEFDDTGDTSHPLLMSLIMTERCDVDLTASDETLMPPIKQRIKFSVDEVEKHTFKRV